MASSAAAAPEGEIEIQFYLELVRPDGTAVALTDEETRVEVQIPDGPEVPVTSRPVDAGRYSTLRVTFTDIDAWIDEGLIIDGDLIDGLIEVAMEDASLVVDRTIDLDVEEGSETDLVVDMNAAEWLEAVDPLTETVDEAFVAQSIQVRVR